MHLMANGWGHNVMPRARERGREGKGAREGERGPKGKREGLFAHKVSTYHGVTWCGLASAESSLRKGPWSKSEILLKVPGVACANFLSVGFRGSPSELEVATGHTTGQVPCIRSLASETTYNSLYHFRRHIEFHPPHSPNTDKLQTLNHRQNEKPYPRYFWNDQPTCDL